jgi:hypothetical protein
LRAGPLSETKVIELLNSYFVPVYISNEDYHKDGIAPGDERQAYQTIYHEALKEKRSAGDVCVYLLTPEGKGLASMIVSTAAEKGKLQALLEKTARQLKTAPGTPVIRPTAQAAPPRAAAGELVFHLVSRYDHRGSWAEFPAENYIVLGQSDVGQLLPDARLAQGLTWEVARTPAGKLLTYFFPQTEMCDCAQMTLENGPYKHRIEKMTLNARVVSIKDGVAVVRLDGGLQLRHKFYPNHDDNNRVTAMLVGYMEIDTGKSAVRKLRLVTSQATYANHPFAAVVRSLKGE